MIWIAVSFQCSDKLGLSLELGSFAAGVMISTTDLGQHTLEQVSLLVVYTLPPIPKGKKKERKNNKKKKFLQLYWFISKML